jgi:energy-coupling factor transport system substrate-specific component
MEEKEMANIVTQEGMAGKSGNRGMASRPVVIVAALAFFGFFVAWIPLYLNVLIPLWGQNNDLALGLSSAVFWLVVFAVTIVAVRWSQTAFEAWTTADLMLTAVLGAVFGLVFLVWALVYDPISKVLVDWAALADGVWFIPAILVPYIIRKPGAALVGETLAGFIAVLLGSPWGFLGSAIAGLTQGIGAEVIFALTGWKRYDWPTLTLAGIGSAVAGFVFVWPLWNIGLSTTLLLINFVGQVIGVLVFAVVGGKLLGDALLSTGVLNRFAIGREKREATAGGEF